MCVWFAGGGYIRISIFSMSVCVWFVGGGHHAGGGQRSQHVSSHVEVDVPPDGAAGVKVRCVCVCVCVYVCVHVFVCVYLCFLVGLDVFANSPTSSKSGAYVCVCVHAFVGLSEHAYKWPSSQVCFGREGASE